MGQFLNHVFSAWNKHGIRYLVLRNYQELPECTSNDVDILVDPGCLVEARWLLEQSAVDNDWLLHNVGEFACLSLFFYYKPTMEQLHIDLMHGINWRALKFMDEQKVLEGRRSFRSFYIPQPTDEAGVNLLTRLVYGGYVREKYRKGIQESARDNRDGLIETMSAMLGRKLAESLVELAREGSWDALESKASQVRRAVWTSNARKPISVVRSMSADLARWIRRGKWSPGISVVFLGPDGCGKTSVASGLESCMSGTFYSEKHLHCHWKPMRPKSANLAPTVDPHGQMRRNSLLSLLYFSYHYLPFVFGWWLFVKPVLFKNGLVIIDRYYYDFFVDQQRYRLSIPTWIIKLGFVFVKKPDLVFCLDADPEILQARKKEVSFDECKRQRDAYRTLTGKLPGGHVVDASQSLEQVVHDVQMLVLGFMKARTAKRMKRDG